MKKLNGKISIMFVIFILLFVEILIYFRPLHLSNLLVEDNTILICENVIETKEGESDINFQSNEKITEQQKKKILELFTEYTYMRKISTVFSDGSFSGNKDEMYLHMYIYDGTTLKNTIVFTDYGEISINSKNYRLKEAGDLINKIQIILME